jgi:RNA polymerase sigma-70 factor (ECF subfamily)
MAEPATHAAEWLSAARGGSREALGRTLEACRGYLLLIAQQELDPTLQAKGGGSDLVQNTMLEAYRDFDGFHGETEAELLQWLRRLLLNNLTDFTRQFRETARRQVNREVPIDPGSSSLAIDLGLAADMPSPSSVAVSREQAHAIERILDRLPDAYRKVVLLRYQGERSFEEIGRELDLTANAARKLLLRAVERVRQELEGQS